MINTLTKIENVANHLLDFPGQKFCMLEISKQQLNELEVDLQEEYDDVILSSVGFERTVFQLELNGIMFTLKIK